MSTVKVAGPPGAALTRPNYMYSTVQAKVKVWWEDVGRAELENTSMPLDYSDLHNKEETEPKACRANIPAQNSCLATVVLLASHPFEALCTCVILSKWLGISVVTLN